MFILFALCAVSESFNFKRINLFAFDTKLSIFVLLLWKLCDLCVPELRLGTLRTDPWIGSALKRPVTLCYWPLHFEKVKQKGTEFTTKSAFSSIN